ncbi:MAG: acyltransferase [Proteobacteria bacterium]|nr:acyltransferase [Pseudomonadota bacterium]
MERRIAQLDGLRAFAFLGVFLRHAIKFPLGWVGVDVFFVLSGYLITRNLMGLRETTPPGRTFGVFYFRRVLRILPPYYLALIAMLLVQHIAASDAAWYFGFVSNFRDAFVGQIVGVYAPMWSIAVEEQFYLIWPCIVLFVPVRRLPLVFGLVIVIAPIFRYAMTPYGFDAVYTLMPGRMDLLAAGALLAYVDKRVPTFFVEYRRKFLLIGLATVATFAIISISDKTFRTNLALPLFNVVGFGLTAVFSVVVFCYVRGLEKGVVMRVLMNPVLQYVGKISYMCYLIHMVVLDLLKPLHLGKIPVSILGLLGTIAIATASWYLAEQPLQKLPGIG